MSQTKPIDYRNLSEELDSIMIELQSVDADIDKSVELYKKGMHIIEQLQTYLKDSENKVAKIKSNWSKK